jgi:hypothetical protein
MKDKDGDDIPTVSPWPGSIQWSIYRQKKFGRSVDELRKKIEIVINQNMVRLLREFKGKV